MFDKVELQRHKQKQPKNHYLKKKSFNLKNKNQNQLITNLHSSRPCAVVQVPPVLQSKQNFLNLVFLF